MEGATGFRMPVVRLIFYLFLRVFFYINMCLHDNENSLISKEGDPFNYKLFDTFSMRHLLDHPP